MNTHSGVQGNVYIPYISAKNPIAVFKSGDPDIEEAVMMYGPLLTPAHAAQYLQTPTRTNFDQVIGYLESYGGPVLWKTSEGRLFHAAKGTLYEHKDGQFYFHMMLAIKNPALWTIKKDENKAENLVLLLQWDFLKDPQNKALVKALETKYFPQVLEIGVDIVHTKSIASKCFNPVTEVYANSFTTLEQRNRYLSQVNEAALYGQSY